MNKVKVLSIISVGLLVANLFLIWFLLSHKPHHGNKGNPKEIIIERLQFDEQQTQQYEKLIDEQRNAVRKSEQQMMMLKNELYSTLAAENQNNLTDSLVLEIGKVQTEIEHINYKHFQDIKHLCKPEQQKLFEELSKEIAKLFSKPLPPDEKR